METPGNRKKRRAATAARASPSSSHGSFNASSIPLSRPPVADGTKNKQKGKTLIEIAAGKQKELLAVVGEKGVSAAATSTLTSEPTETQFLQISPSGEVSRFDPQRQSLEHASQPETPLPPLIDTIFLSFPLSTVHFTLAYLAAHQYAQNIPVLRLARESVFLALPVLTCMIHFAHGHVISFSGRSKPRIQTKEDPSRRGRLGYLMPSWRTIFFLPPAIYFGSCLMVITNESPYYAVMKSAPAVGTLWLWCVLEMSFGAALLGVLTPLGWGVLWKGYKIL